MPLTRSNRSHRFAPSLSAFRPRRRAVAAAALACLALPAAAAQFSWTGGDYVPGVTAPQPIGAGDVLNIGAGGNKFINNATLTNNGTVNWLADVLYLQNGGTVQNGGVWSAQGDFSMLYNGGAATVFNNTGSFVKTAGSAALSIGQVGFVNSGVVDAQSGSITFSGGSVFNAGSSFIGAGSVVAGSGTNTFNGALSSGSLVLQGGTFQGNAAQIGGNVTLTGGNISGTWEVASGQSLSGRDGGNKFLIGGGTVLTNKGTIDWGTSGLLYLQDGATLANQALFLASESTQMTYNGGAATTFDNQATGTVRAAAGKTLTIGNLGFVNNGGTLDAAAGGSILYNGGTSVFNAGTRFTGAGSNVVNNSATFNGQFNSGNLVLQGGTFTGNAAVVTGNAVFTGGYLSGTWEVASGHTLSGRDGGNKFLIGGGTVLTNKGTIDWGTGGLLYLQDGATLANQALFVASESTQMTYNGGAATTFDNQATGTVRAAAGKTLTIGNLGFVNNGGTLDAAAGGSIVYNGGTSVFNAGTRFTGAGSNVVNSNATFNGQFNSGNLVLQGGTFTGGDGVTPGSKAELASGTVAFSGGTLNGAWRVNAGTTLAGVDGGNKFVTGAGTTVTNQGRIAWGTAGLLYLQDGASVVNQGTFDLQTDAGIAYNGGAAVSFVNAGRLVKSAGNGTAVIGDNAGFSNLGTVEVASGTLRLPGNFTNAGTLKGTGTFETNVLTNNGHLAPGASPGTLTLNGNYAQTAAGSFDVELGGISLHDKFIVNGTATLGGTLALSCWATCNFAVGDSVVILDSTGALSGSFSSLTLSGFATGAFDVVYDSVNTRVLLNVTEAVTAVPEPHSYALLLLGLGWIGTAGWRRRTRQA